MRLTSMLRSNFIEMECGPHSDAFDLLLIVRVQYATFTGSTDVWIPREAWFGFVQDLTILEERRQGAARLESVTPGELELHVRSLDSAGHLGVEGLLGYRTHDENASMRFGIFAFDPSQLAPFVHEGRAISTSLR